MAGQYVKTHTVLDKILAHTAEMLPARQVSRPLAELQSAAAEAAPPRDMLAALRPAGQTSVSLLAEVKHASPSRGVLVEDFQPVVIAEIYAAHGAAAISVLTDEAFFQGHLDYLTAVKQAVHVPVLRKDFIIDPYQVYEGRAAGADAILLIVAALADSQLADLHTLINDLGMTALVEVHNEAELERAMCIYPRLLGINNRNLKTFEVSLDVTARLAKMVPPETALVAESGIFTAEDVRQVAFAGAHAILVGESLVTAADTASLVQTLSSQPR